MQVLTVFKITATGITPWEQANATPGFCKSWGVSVQKVGTGGAPTMTASLNLTISGKPDDALDGTAVHTFGAGQLGKALYPVDANDVPCFLPANCYRLNVTALDLNGNDHLLVYVMGTA